MKLFITGIRGFLGSAMAEHFRARGHEVRGNTALRLGEPFDAEVFRGADVVIHAAHDFASGAREKNLRGTRAWFEAACGARQIFLSSYSARPDAASEYGETKHALEKMFLEAGQVVVRPGLVIGNGGLFAKQRAALRRTPVVPLVGGGKSPVAVVAIRHFLDAMTVVVEDGRRGPFNLFYEPLPSAREFVRAAKGGSGWVLPVPASVALGAARLVEILRLPLPINAGQVRALAANASSPWRSDLSDLLPGREKEFCLAYALVGQASQPACF